MTAEQAEILRLRGVLKDISWDASYSVGCINNDTFESKQGRETLNRIAITGRRALAESERVLGTISGESPQ